MAEIETMVVRRSEEESAASRVAIFEVNHNHAIVNPDEWPTGEIFIADDAGHLVAATAAVKEAVKKGRLVQIKTGAMEVEADEVQATDKAVEYAEAHEIELAEVPPTGKNGTITLTDVKKYELRQSGG